MVDLDDRADRHGRRHNPLLARNLSHARPLPPGAGFLAAAAGYLVMVMVVAFSGLFGDLDGVAATLVSALAAAGLFSFSIGWVVLGWTAIRADRLAPALA